MATYQEEEKDRPQSYARDVEEQLQEGYTPDESFANIWEEYIADDDLVEEFTAYKMARSRFLGLIRGPYISTWMQESARWLMAAAEYEDEINALDDQLSDPGNSDFPHNIDDVGEDACLEVQMHPWEEEFPHGEDADEASSSRTTTISW